MKNRDIVRLSRFAFDKITTHSLASAYAYRFYKFKKALSAAFVKVAETEAGLMKEVGIEDIGTFNTMLLESGKDVNSKEYKECSEKASRFTKMQNELYEEEADFSDVKPIAFRDWHKLKEENKGIVGESGIEILSEVEPLLENILWIAPDEE